MPSARAISALRERGEVVRRRAATRRPRRWRRPGRGPSRRRSRTRRRAARRAPAIASSSRVWPRSRANASSASIRSKSAAASRSGRPARRVPSGGGSPRRNLPVSRPLASGKYGTKPMPSSRQSGSISSSASRSSRLYSFWSAANRSSPSAAASRSCARVEVRHAERADLPLVGQLAERADGLGERGHAVRLVVVEEVDPVGPQARERGLDRAAGIRARTARLAGVAAHRHAELGREHDAVAAALEHLADEPLGRAVAAVDVRGVEERDAGVERRVDHGAGPGEVQPAAEVVAAEADGRHRELGASERVLLHGSQDGRRSAISWECPAADDAIAAAAFASSSGPASVRWLQPVQRRRRRRVPVAPILALAVLVALAAGAFVLRARARRRRRPVARRRAAVRRRVGARRPRGRLAADHGARRARRSRSPCSATATARPRAPRPSRRCASGAGASRATGRSPCRSSCRPACSASCAGRSSCPVERTGETAAVAWSPDLRLPGLEPGERVQRRDLRQPRTASVLDADGHRLSRESTAAALAGHAREGLRRAPGGQARRRAALRPAGDRQGRARAGPVRADDDPPVRAGRGDGGARRAGGRRRRRAPAQRRRARARRARRHRHAAARVVVQDRHARGARCRRA